MIDPNFSMLPLNNHHFRTFIRRQVMTTLTLPSSCISFSFIIHEISGKLSFQRQGNSSKALLSTIQICAKETDSINNKRNLRSIKDPSNRASKIKEDMHFQLTRFKPQKQFKVNKVSRFLKLYHTRSDLIIHIYANDCQFT